MVERMSLRVRCSAAVNPVSANKRQIDAADRKARKCFRGFGPTFSPISYDLSGDTREFRAGNFFAPRNKSGDSVMSLNKVNQIYAAAERNAAVDHELGSIRSSRSWWRKSNRLSAGFGRAGRLALLYHGNSALEQQLWQNRSIDSRRRFCSSNRRAMRIRPMERPTSVCHTCRSIARCCGSCRTWAATLLSSEWGGSRCRTLIQPLAGRCRSDSFDCDGRDNRKAADKIRIPKQRPSRLWRRAVASLRKAVERLDPELRGREERLKDTARSMPASDDRRELAVRLATCTGLSRRDSVSNRRSRPGRWNSTERERSGTE